MFEYAEKYSKYYDSLVDIISPEVQLLSDYTLEFMIQILTKIQNRDQANVSGVFLDIGSGTGLFALSLLKLLPKIKIVALDGSSDMHQQFRNNYHDSGLKAPIESRVKFVTIDLNDLNDPNSMKALLDSEQQVFSVIYSNFTLHHLPIEVKEHLYKIIYNSLKDDGLFLNHDICLNAFSLTNQISLDHSLLNCRKDIQAEVAAGGIDIPAKTVKKIQQHWLDHILNENVPCSEKQETTMLKNVGFQQVEMLLRFWEAGLLLACKQESLGCQL